MNFRTIERWHALITMLKKKPLSREQIQANFALTNEYYTARTMDRDIGDLRANLDLAIVYDRQRGHYKLTSKDGDELELELEERIRLLARIASTGVLNDTIRGYARNPHLRLDPTQIRHGLEYLQTLLEGASERRVFRLAYQSFTREDVRHYIFEPGLVTEWSNRWYVVGFCHGVMNTDNMSILGLTIDYGPFQFLDAFDPTHICNHSDTQGRYAYNKQPNIAYWNLFCLGQALLPLIGEQDQALAALEPFKTIFPAALEAKMLAKLGLTEASPDSKALIESTFKLLAANKVDYTIFWRRLFTC
jgi:hypothetical protein